MARLRYDIGYDSTPAGDGLIKIVAENLDAGRLGAGVSLLQNVELPGDFEPLEYRVSNGELVKATTPAAAADTNQQIAGDVLRATMESLLEERALLRAMLWGNDVAERRLQKWTEAGWQALRNAYIGLDNTYSLERLQAGAKGLIEGPAGIPTNGTVVDRVSALANMLKDFRDPAAGYAWIWVTADGQRTGYANAIAWGFTDSTYQFGDLSFIT